MREAGKGCHLHSPYGTGHGRTCPTGLQPRHARLVVGAAARLTRFLLETLDFRRQQGHREPGSSVKDPGNV